MTRLPFIALSLLSFFAQADQKIEVKDDSNNGVSSGIYFKDVNNHKGDTNPDGVFVSASDCSVGELVIAKPKSDLYENGVARCVKGMETVALRVTWKPLYANLIQNRDYFIAQGDFAAAALASNEIAARTADVSIAKQQQVSALESFAKYLQVAEDLDPVAYDPLQNRDVATPQFVDAIKQYQIRHGLNASGMIDNKTLATAAGLNVGDIMYSNKAH
ncbi:peptidoglycan-binding domain-containing protein [Ferrimonas aestuarii]|nr:peptidoglycan-binding domain-containing protein [Ferrimonas aestuarii]